MKIEKRNSVNIENEAGVDMEKESDVDLEKESDVDLEKESDVDLEKKLYINLEKEPDVDLEKEPDVDLEKEPDNDLEKEPGIGMEKEQAVDMERNPDVDTEKEPNLDLESDLAVTSEKNVNGVSEKELEAGSKQEQDVNLGAKQEINGEIKPAVNLQKEADVLDHVLEKNDSSVTNEMEQSIQKVGPWLEIHEAELNAYLEAEKPKPKKLTIAERLKRMPGFAQLSNFKPVMGRGCKPDNGGTIDLNFVKPQKTPNKGLQELMNRFAEHTKVIKPEKEQHFKIHVSKKEEDSQGVEHIVTDEVDYIKTINSDDESEITGSSPRNEGEIPGARMFKHKHLLKQKIYAQKAKEFAEKMKLHAMYAEEKELEDKVAYDPVLDNEEEMDGSSESEIDEDEEEELEDLLSGTRKEKKRKRIAYIDDEAEDSDEGGDEDEGSDVEDVSDEDSCEDDGADDGDDDGEDDGHDDKENVIKDDELIKLDDIEIDKNVDGAEDDFGMGIDSECQFSLPSAQPQLGNKQILNDEAAANANTVKICLQKLDITPQLQQKTPSDLWLRPIVRCPQRVVTPDLTQIEESNSESISTSLSQIEEMSLGNSQFSSSCKSSIPAAVIDLVEGVGDRTTQNNDDLIAVCSGSFPSQQPKTPEESQNDCFGFDDDDDLILATLDESGNVAVDTPKAVGNQNKSVLENDTPKLSDRVSTTKRLIFEEDKGDYENKTPKHSETVSKTVLFPSVEDENDADSDFTDDEDVGVVRNVKKRKRLAFSDEEDEADSVSAHSDNEVDDDEEEDVAPVEDEEMAMEMEMEARTTKTKKSLFGKSGKLRKEFIDAEAELSGSEIGSEDEDERGLDRMEMEEADEEVIDEDEVREKVGRAHLKALLDEDDKDIQDLQDKFLHDGDLLLEGGRQRNFKWNYMEYDLEDDRANMPDFGQPVPLDEDEMKRQVEKAEKTKWMQENSQLFEESQQESQKSLLGNTNFLKLGKSNLRKLTSFSESSSFQGCDLKDSSISFTSFSRLLTGQVKNIITTNVGEKKDDELPLCKATSQPLFASPDEPISKLRKGSFLSRGAPSLSRLAEMTKINDSVSNVKSNSKNFVFSVITPPNDSKEDSQSNTKKVPLRRNQSLTSNPKKMLKIDRSFNNLDSSSKETSIFRWI